jgi:Holliday junction resolvase
MKTETYERLKKIFNKYGPTKGFGKLSQQLVALAFDLADFKVNEVRLVEGIDIDVLTPSGKKYAIEVKTTESRFINFKQKDVDGLQKRKEDGYQPVLAVLRLDRFSDWIFAKADKIKPGRRYIDSLRVYRMHELEEHIVPFFDKVLQEHYRGIMREGQKYLDNLLRQKGVKVRKTGTISKFIRERESNTSKQIRLYRNRG